jgi:hypothetical protein
MTKKPIERCLHPVCSALDGREVAQIVGVITALSAMTSATPSLIIGKLTGTLWTIKEASELLNAARLYEPLNDRIIQDLVCRPNDKDLARRALDSE